MNLITKTAIAAAALCLAASCTQTPFFQNEAYTWQNDTISLNDGSIRAYAPDAHTIISNYPESEFPDGVWKLSRDISHLPSYSAPTRLEEALYNLALEESVIAVEPDSTLRTGKNWSGVWTRDISYSILLALSHVQTQASINSLVRKVDALGRIIQDTGTGGSWPCSTDRTIWTVAAWEIYKVTGDENWLEYIYPIIKNSVETDLLVALDSQTGLFRGESSYLDWREQEYPRWMAPVDIYVSENLGTVCVHYQNLRILSAIASKFGDTEDAARYSACADAIAEGINKHLWLPDKGYYAQFLYGRQNLIASPRSETLGEALAILYGIADNQQAATICSSVPELTYGTSCFFPNIVDIPPYHNDAMWPFVQAYWMDACKKAGNETAVLHAIASLYRLSAFCLTNKENMVIYNGKWQGTQINSSRQLWSIAGNLNIVFNVLFGIDFKEDGLAFTPFVPKAMAGERKLTGFRYRGATYDILLKGYGDGIRSFSLDGQKSAPFIPATSCASSSSSSCSSYCATSCASDCDSDHHQIVIILNGHSPKGTMNQVANAYSPLTPSCRIEGDTLLWNPDEAVSSWKVILDGKVVAETSEPSYHIAQDGEYQVIAQGLNGYESFASEPLNRFSDITLIELENYTRTDYSTGPYTGYSGKGYLDLTIGTNTTIDFTVDVPTDGTYALDFRFANANGPVNTQNKCAIRTLWLDGIRLGAVVMPHCGTDAYDIWRWTNSCEVALMAGTHHLRLVYSPEDCNMNIQTNSAALDAARLIRLR